MKLDMLSYLGTDYAKDKQLIKKILSNPTILVGWVDSFNADNGTVNIQPAIQDKIIDENSVLNYVNKPYLVNCWVISNTLNRQPQKGDKALILVLDEKSNNFFKSQYDSTKTLSTQTFVNTSKNIKSLANSVAIIVNSNYAEGIGTVVNVNGVAQDEINFTSDPQTQITENTNNISQLSNPNLLINGDFSINQRGQEEYGNATQYTVDRWQLSTRTNANLSFNAITKTLSNTGTISGYFIQRIEPNDVDKIWGKTWTFSVKINGTVYSQTFTAPSTAPTSSQGIAPTLVCVQNICNVRLFYYANRGTIGFTFDIFTGSVTLEYAKLEIGSVATPFSPRPYAEELLLCQRYYQVLGIDSVAYSTYGAVSYENEEYYAANTSIPLISTMRTTPTVKIITMPSIRNYNNLNSTAFRMNQIILFRNNEIQLQFLADGVERGAIYVSYAGLVSLDAEIY